MADLDTAEKRRSSVGIHLYASGPGVTPNAAQDKEWRQEAGYGYMGITVGEDVESTHTRTGFGRGYTHTHA